ncbi:MAG: ATP-binding cassette domain-containing protein [Candidatus Omnitrophota bacterium]
MMMLEVKDISVEVSGHLILQGVNMHIRKGEVVVLFGPNGSGKSTLLKAIMGFEGYKVISGEILLGETRIDGLPVEERVKLGLGLMYQHPPQVRGVKLAQVAGRLNGNAGLIKEMSERLSLSSHLSRDINMGFSGGEMKRSELFQLILQDPDLLLLDEPESGVDLENISVMGKVLNGYLKEEGKSALIITHTGYILDYINARKGCVMIDGKMWCVGRPKEIFGNIRERGYDKCMGCDDRAQSAR